MITREQILMILVHVVTYTCHRLVIWEVRLVRVDDDGTGQDRRVNVTTQHRRNSNTTYLVYMCVVYVVYMHVCDVYLCFLSLSLFVYLCVSLYLFSLCLWCFIMFACDIWYCVRVSKGFLNVYFDCLTQFDNGFDTVWVYLTKFDNC